MQSAQKSTYINHAHSQRDHLRVVCSFSLAVELSQAPGMEPTVTRYTDVPCDRRKSTAAKNLLRKARKPGENVSQSRGIMEAWGGVGSPIL